MSEDPHPEAKNFLDMMATANTPLYDGCDNFTKLSAAVEALSIKSNYNDSEGSFNRWVDFIGRALPKDNEMPTNYYHAKKIGKELGLGCIKIHCCIRGCMIYYYSLDKDLHNCKHCGEEHFTRVTKNGKVRETPHKKNVVLSTYPKTSKTLFLHANCKSNEMAS